MIETLRGHLRSFLEQAVPYGHGPHPDDVTMDPIRSTVVSGRGMILLTGGRDYPLVIEAARVCGRTDDLRVVYTTASAMDKEGLDDGARCLPREGFPGMSKPSKAGTVRLNSPSHGVGVLPDLTLDEATEPGRIVVFVGGNRLAERVATHFHAAAIERAAACGGSPPVFITIKQAITDVGLTSFRRPDGWILQIKDPSQDAAAHAHGGTAHGRRAWLEAISAYDAGTAIVERGSEAWASRGGRFVLVRHARIGVSAFEGYEITEVPALGLPRIVKLARQEFDRARMRRLVALVMRGGIGRVADSESNERYHADCHFAGTSLGTTARDGTTDGIEQALGRIDVELARAMPYTHNRELIHRIVVGGPPSTIRPRREFVLTWPGCHGALLEPWLRDGVDQGREGVPLAARFLDTSEVAARRLVGVAPGSGPLGTVPTRNVLPGLGPILRRISHGHLPARGDVRQWDALIRIFLSMETLLLRLGIFTLPVEQAVALAVRSTGKDWLERQVRLSLGAGRFDPGLVADAVQGLAAWLTGIAGNDVCHETALLVLAGPNGSLDSLTKAQSAWHADRLLRESHGLDGSGEGWGVPFGPVDLGRGWTARVLASPEDLRAEGADGTDEDGVAGLAHCVRGYARSCRSGESLILSLRRRGGAGEERVSTAELVLGEGDWTVGGRRYVLSQHRAHRNAMPSRDATERLALLRTMLAESKVAVDEVEPSPMPADAADGNGDMAARREARRREALDLWPAWRRILPAPYRGMDAEALAGAVAAIEAGIAAR